MKDNTPPTPTTKQTPTIEEQAETIVLNQLTARPRSRHELQQTLQRRNIPAHTIEQVLNRAEQANLINDELFAYTWAQSRHHNKGLAPHAIRYELTQKGVDPAHIETALTNITTQNLEETARKLAEQKLRTLTGLPQETQTRRIASMLARKGYPPNITYQIAKETAHKNSA